MHCNHKLSKAHEEPVCRTCGANLLNHEPHMKIEIALKDINGKALAEGSRVCAYAQDYAEISRDESGGIPVIEVDHAKPKPIKDVPLFIGRVVWNPEQLAIEIAIEEMLVEWATSPSRVRMGGGNYAYELIG